LPEPDLSWEGSISIHTEAQLLTIDRYNNEHFKILPQGEDLRTYLEEGRPTNHFLTALLENDLMECMGRADTKNRQALYAYCIWLQTYTPRSCYGSKERMTTWIAHKGLSGLDDEYSG